MNDQDHMTGEIQMVYKFEGGFLLFMLIQLLNALRIDFDLIELKNLFKTGFANSFSFSPFLGRKRKGGENNQLSFI